MNNSDEKIGPLISKIFRFLQLVAMGLLLIALMTALFQLPINRIFSYIGIALVIIIPIVGVIAAMIEYMRRKNYTMAIMAAIVLVVIIAALLISLKS